MELWRGSPAQVVIELAREEGFQVVEELFTRYEVYTAEECFLTGTAAELIPVVRVDGRKIGSGKPGPVTQQLTEAFHRLTQVTGTPVYSE
ncbi:MAG: hypothetical protein KatS3mg115_0338 [Candidatus Poribacteria bacterium]|nr:MAG: hypothetical protein KatS3mg115_0338 [Candidatus Poribacteria bacterium]